MVLEGERVNWLGEGLALKEFTEVIEAIEVSVPCIVCVKVTEGLPEAVVELVTEIVRESLTLTVTDGLAVEVLLGQDVKEEL